MTAPTQGGRTQAATPVTAGRRIYMVTPETDGRTRLRTIIDSGRGPKERRRRAHVLLPADRDRPGGGRGDAGIADVPGTGTATVERVRRQCVPDGLDAAPERRVRVSRRPRLPDGAGEAKLAMPGCPAPPGGRAGWAPRPPGDRPVAPGVVDTIPAETVRRTTGKTVPGPGRPGAGAFRPGRVPTSFVAWRMS